MSTMKKQDTRYKIQEVLFCIRQSLFMIRVIFRHRVLLDITGLCAGRCQSTEWNGKANCEVGSPSGL